GVINQTIPVILCTEEDVEGVHGATIGRLAQDMMFYMESRGISEEEIYRMMSRARIESAASAIPDETAKKIVTDYLDRMEA
ncbi:MAG: SufD family Fe-S cluster assembly protein, partial [Eubacteriales bacterium]|nr:SufD family Fe-S cluster assembly protein [Eubacteriales bacterium]